MALIGSNPTGRAKFDDPIDAPMAVHGVCCTDSDDQFPIALVDTGAPIPRLRSLAGFEHRVSVRVQPYVPGPASENRYTSSHSPSTDLDKARPDYS